MHRQGKAILKNTAFTLIELLVVISIISLISSVVLSNIKSSRLKAADAKTSLEYNQIRLALELYQNDHGKYPSPPLGYYCIGACRYNGIAYPPLGPALTGAGQPNFAYAPSTSISQTSADIGFVYYVTSAAQSVPKRLIFRNNSRGVLSTDVGIWSLSTGSN